MVKFSCRSMNNEGLPKNTGGFRTTHTCELCGFEPRTKNKYREKQDHLVMKHFKEKIDKIFPHCRPYSCPYGKDSDNCPFIGKDKQALLRHYTGKHGILEQFLREALAEKGIEYLEDHPKRKSSTDSRNGKKSPQTLGISNDIPTELLPTTPVPIATTTASTTPPTQNNEELRQEVESLMACLQPQPVQIQGNRSLMQVNLPQQPDPIRNGNLNARLSAMSNGIINNSTHINGNAVTMNGTRNGTPNIRAIVTMAETNLNNGVVNICNGQQTFSMPVNNGGLPNLISNKVMSNGAGSNGHILNVGNGLPSTITLPTMPISKVNTMINNTTLSLPMNPLPPMSVALPKQPNTIVVPTSNVNERMDITVPQLISAHITSNGSSNIPTIISEGISDNNLAPSSNGILGNHGQTVNLMRHAPSNGNLTTSSLLTNNTSLPVLSGNIIPNNSSEASSVKMSKLQSILSTALPSRGIPTVINMNNDASTTPSLPPLHSLTSKASNTHIPLPMDVVSRLTCALPTTVSNSAINGVNGMVISHSQHQPNQVVPNPQHIQSSNAKTNQMNSCVDIAAEAAAEVMEQSAKNVLENEEVMWGAPHGGPAVVVEIADTVPVTYIEANGEIMETKYEMSINGVGNSSGFGNGGVSVTALDDMDYNYISSVTHNNDHLQNYQKTLDFCML